MKTVNVNKKALGPTLAKGDNDDKPTTIDLGEYCNGVFLDGGVGGGGSCRDSDWKGSVSVKPDGSYEEKVTKHNYSC